MVEDATNTHRYLLGYNLGQQGQTITWCLLNPSTATGDVPDPTMRRVIDFSRRWGYGRALITNLFPLRSTDPRGLKTIGEGLGIDAHANLLSPRFTTTTFRPNTAAITLAIQVSDVIVAGWGSNVPKTMMHVAAAITELIRISGKGRCLRLNADGSPGHPLYLRADTELKPYPSNR